VSAKKERRERRSGDMIAPLPREYRGMGKRRSSPGAQAPLLFDRATGYFTLPVLAEFIQYEIDGYAQMLANEHFITPMCLAAIGIDALNDIEDEEEHAQLLQVVGDDIHRITRAADRLARHETEFFALLRRTLSRNVREFYAPRIAELVAESSHKIDLPTTVCIGVASISEHLVRDPNDMIAKARRALEAARESGPGSVEVYDHRAMPLR